MFLYTVRRLNLFIITMLILTMVGFSILRLEPNSPWAIEDFWSGWMTYLSELMQLNFGVDKRDKTEFKCGGCLPCHT